MRERGSTLCTRPLGLALLLACGLSIARANYLFTEEPIARLSPALGDTDLFGYAVALHRLDDTGAPTDFDHAITNTKILVGAPNGTFPGGLTFIGVNDSEALNRTGLVYICPITPGDCESVSGNGMGNDIRLFDYEGNEFTSGGLQFESKEGQFMGATIVSSGDHVVICAPRWINFIESPRLFDGTRAHGRCFSSGRDLTDFELLRPCVSGQSDSQRNCMAGTSAAVYERGSNDFSLFLGGPPFSDNTGGVFEYNNNTVDHVTFESGEGFQYGGFSVALGRIISSDEIDIVASFPKTNTYRGSVQVFDRSSVGSVLAEVVGEQIGEYFGWVVATADLNGDSFDEILVGAPLFSTPDGNGIERGRVFIYKNNGTLDTENPIIITGTVGKGRFGSAIVNVGDINNDGFEDIAISAPFEDGEDEAQGTVYIYLGSGEDVINLTPDDMQIITAQNISSALGLPSDQSLKTFGYSLSSGVDVDANFYNDLVVGGYKQQTVVVLRAQSRANITLSLSTVPEDQLEYDMPNENCSVKGVPHPCFDLKISASFFGRGLDGRPLNTTFVVSEDAVPEGARLFFLDTDGNRADTFTGELNFNTTNKTKMDTVRVYVENDLVDRRTNLAVVVGVFSPERQPRPVDDRQDIIDLRDIPILTVLPQNNMIAQLSLAGCDDPTNCMPDLELTLVETRYRDEITSNGFDLIARTLQGEDVDLVDIVLEYQTLGDDALNVSLMFTLPTDLLQPPLSIESRRNSDLLQSDLKQCVKGDNDVYTCELERIISEFEGVFRVTITIPVQNLVGDENNRTLTFMIMNEDRNDISNGNNAVSIDIRVSARADVTIQDLMFDPNTTQYNDNDMLGKTVRVQAGIINRGPSTIPNATLIVRLPGEMGRFYLYPTTSTQCSMGLNPDGLNQVEIQKRKRETRGNMERLRRMIGAEPEEKKIVKRAVTQTTNCSVNPDRCIAIICNISDLPSSVAPFTITFSTKVDNRFLQTQGGDIQLYAFAEFNITNSFFEPESLKPVTQQSREPLILVELVDQPIPIWVYIVAVIAGLLVIALIIILLVLLVVCLRSRTKKKISRAMERRRSTLHGNVVGSTGMGPVVTSLDSKPELGPGMEPEKPLDEKPPAEDLPDVAEDAETEI